MPTGQHPVSVHVIVTRIVLVRRKTLSYWVTTCSRYTVRNTWKFLLMAYVVGLLSLVLRVIGGRHNGSDGSN